MLNFERNDYGVLQATIFLIPRFQWCMAFDIDKDSEGRYVVQASVLGGGMDYASGAAHLDRKNHEFSNLHAAIRFCESVVREVRDTLIGVTQDD